MNERHDPYAQQFWGNTQKHTVSEYFNRFMVGGFAIGDNEELIIVRHPIDLLQTPFQAEATVESQTGLHIVIKDTRADVVGLKLSKEGNGSDFVRLFDDGTQIARITSAGAIMTGSLAELKKNMKDLTEKQIVTILEGVDVYRYQYKKEPGVVYVSPEAAEFHKLTGFGDKTTISPSTLGGLALRLVKWVWDKVKGYEDRIAHLETQLALQNMEDDAASDSGDEAEA